ncbi:MAG: DUF2461 domain-containing protein [Candidatus Aminicenantes bacterium]|nr:DUF2461 domain-containing protein [Candidatus Aminicenantes bacterium]
MPENATFTGFSQETVRFFRGLKRNNDRVWFERHRATYENDVLAPSRAFVLALGARLRSVVPHLVAVPKVNGSIFRINRDTRFSLDPSPYKTNLGLYFWEGTSSRMEASGFYFHVEPPNLILGGGVYVIPPLLLGRYRKAVVHPRLARDLARIAAGLAASGDLTIGGTHYKRIPAGFDAGHSNAAFLLHNGLYASWEGPLPEDFYSERLVEFCFARFARMVPLHRWLVDALWGSR